MEHINKVKRQFFLDELGLSSGGLPVLELKWLSEKTDKNAIHNTISDLWYQLFLDNGVRNMKEYVALFGYTGGLNKTLPKYYETKINFVLNLTSDLDIRGL